LNFKCTARRMSTRFLSVSALILLPYHRAKEKERKKKEENKKKERKTKNEDPFYLAEKLGLDDEVVS